MENKMKKIINLTPHMIVLNDGTEFPPSGTIARVSSSFSKVDEIDGIPIFSITYGDVENLPPEEENTIFIVSSMVLEALKNENRSDVVAPATGHPSVVRDEKGQIKSVPGFVKL